MASGADIQWKRCFQEKFSECLPLPCRHLLHSRCLRVSRPMPMLIFGHERHYRPYLSIAPMEETCAVAVIQKLVVFHSWQCIYSRLGPSKDTRMMKSIKRRKVLMKGSETSMNLDRKWGKGGRLELRTSDKRVNLIEQMNSQSSRQESMVFW